MSKKKFRLTVTQDSYCSGHVDIEADSAVEAEGMLCQDDHYDNIVWDEFNDGGELCVQDVKELKNEGK